jgi:hypothetical protein
MATVLASHEPEILRDDCSVVWTSEKDLAINLSIDVDADARRIFQALTVPEYIETWITFPSQASDSIVQATEEENGYRIDHYAEGRRAVSIRSSYLFRHQRKMRMCWRKVRALNCDESVVDFRLRGNFARSVLELKHTAIESPAELDWLLRLWHNSLCKLASLLKSA